ncbi:MAG: DNA methyltransferase [Promethearchaeota archaeon]
MQDDKVVNSSIIAKAHDNMHVMHKYWSRKPFNVVRAYIEASTREGDIVLDPFCGSGVSVSQSLMLGRKVIGLDLNPMAIFITRNTITRLDIEKIYKTFEKLAANVRDKIESLYKTRCPKCLSIDSTSTTCFHWKVHHPIKVIYTCSNCHANKKRWMKQRLKMPDAEDMVLLDKIDAMAWPTNYLNKDIPPGMVFDQARKKAKKFRNLFTKRNFIALSLLLDAIYSLPESTQQDQRVKNSFLYAFSSIVHLCSKMTPVRPSRPYSSFWATNSYWIPEKFMESNVWRKFESAIFGPQGLLSAKKDTNKKLPLDFEIVKTFDDLKETDGPCVLLKVHDATKLDEIIPTNSIDYIFTDPPYAGSIPFLELSTLWASWLGLDDQFKYDDEILINTKYKKDLNYFSSRLEVFFRKAFDVLKPGKKLEFTYHNLDIQVRKTILKGPIFAGFKLKSIIYQPPPRTSAAHTLRPFNSAVGDYIVSFTKSPSGEPFNSSIHTPSKISRSELLQIEREVIDLIVNELIKNEKPLTFTRIINFLDVKLFNKPWYFDANIEPIKIMKKHLGDVFIKKQVKIGSKVGYKWWLSPTYLKKLNIKESMHSS